jgi:hypothetical protein
MRYQAGQKNKAVSSNKYWRCLLALTLLWTASLALARAQKETGYVHIIADPDVSVFVDGKLAGQTSSRDRGLVLTDIAAGKHRLRFEKSGFKPQQTELSVLPGEVTVYTLYSSAPYADIQERDIGRTGYMEPKTGVLELICLPVYCSISIPELELENYQKESSKLTIRPALATRYRVTIRVGSARLRETVELEPNTTLRLFANFADGRPQLGTTVIRPEIRRVETPKPAVQNTPTGNLPPKRAQAPKPTVQERTTYEVTLEQPLAVLLSNADAAYPQQGLVEAASVFEMPVEGGLTGLMSVYTRDEPAQVGPIRSARDYFLEAALSMNGTLVHVGGAPSTVGRIASQGLTTLDAEQEGALFAQAPDRLAPYDTFSAGAALRDAVGSQVRQVSGTLYTPPADAPDASSVTVDYSVDYSSGFRYLPDLDQYRWQRNGADAADAAGVAVAADAVVVARVVAFPYPDDLEGRLYLPYSGGEATLYLRGKVVPGSWSPEDGFTFQTQTGAEVDLTPFKHWILFAPEEAQVSAEWVFHLTRAARLWATLCP